MTDLLEEVLTTPGFRLWTRPGTTATLHECPSVPRFVITAK